MNKIFKWYAYINKPVIQKSPWADLLLFIPRFVCGALLAFDFGASKFGMPWSDPALNLGLFEVVYWFPDDVAQFGGIFAMFPVFFAWVAGFSETMGGLALLLGLKTRIAGFLIVCTMLVAIFFQQIDNGVWNTLPALGFLWVGLYSLINGSGRFGLDYLIIKRMK
jgi:putative oxidoreductase